MGNENTLSDTKAMAIGQESGAERILLCISTESMMTFPSTTSPTTYALNIRALINPPNTCSMFFERRNNSPDCLLAFNA